MNRGVKAIGIILSLVLLSVLLLVAAVNSPYWNFSFMLASGSFWQNVLTSPYLQVYLFWAAAAFSVLLILGILFFIFYPRVKRKFVLKEGAGKLSLDKKAVEGFVRSKLDENEFVDAPKINVHATKNKIKVKVKGELTRTSSILGKTRNLMEEIRQELQYILGNNEKVKVDIAYSNYDQKNKESSESSRVV